MTIEADEYLRRQRSLADFGEFALICEDLQTILQEGCRLVAGALGADLAKITQIEPGGEWGLVRAGVGWKDGIVGHERVSLIGRTSFAVATASRQPVVSNDAEDDERFELPVFMHEHGVAAFVNVPLIVPGGELFGFLEVDHSRDLSFGEPEISFLRTYAAVLGPVIDRLLKIRELEHTNERYRLIVENARDYVIILSDPDNIITGWLPGADAILGWSQEEMIGRSVAAIFTPEDQERGAPAHEIRTAMANGVAPDVRWHSAKNGRRVFLDGQMIAMYQPSGELQGFLKIGQDVTERKRNEERRTILLSELQHRVRNVLAIVGALVKRTDSSISTPEFQTILTGRIHAMARTQALLTRGAGVGVDVAGIVRDELTAQGIEGSGIAIRGPETVLAPRAAEVLTLAIHELATNALKYGSLHEPSGRLDVSWTTSMHGVERWFDFLWAETGYAVRPSTSGRKGFGTELITRRVPYELQGEGRLDFEADGLRCRISFPLKEAESVLQTSIPVSQHQSAGEGS